MIRTTVLLLLLVAFSLGVSATGYGQEKKRDSGENAESVKGAEHQAEELRQEAGEKLPAQKPLLNLDEELCIAASKGKLDRVQQLLDQGVSASARDLSGFTPLEHAATMGHTEIVKLLIARGADVNGQDVMGGTPLFRACAEGRVETVKALIVAGADVNAKSVTGVTVLTLTRKEGHEEIVRLLKEAGATE